MSQKSRGTPTIRKVLDGDTVLPVQEAFEFLGSRNRVLIASYWMQPSVGTYGFWKNS